MRRLDYPTCLLVIAIAAILTALVEPKVAAQAISTSITDRGTPPAVAPGAPAGSYPLSGFDTVNIYSGHLNFHLPLLAIGGRGGAGYAMTLPIERNWRAVSYKYYTGPGSNSWSTPTWYPDPNPWDGIKVGYGPGVLQGRLTRDKAPEAGFSIPPGQVDCYSLTRLSFTTADGTEYELRDAGTDGKPIYSVAQPGVYTGPLRGKVFVSRDGTSVTFTSDADIYDVACADTSMETMLGVKRIYPSGYLMTSDGDRYRIDNGLVTWMRDRNGNKLSFTYSNNQVATMTDSLNRQVSVSYLLWDGTKNQYYDKIAFTGFGSATRNVRVWYKELQNALRSGFTVRTYAQLFPQLNGSSTTQGPGSLRVVSAVEIPDGRQYEFQYNDYAELARVILPTGGAYEYDYNGAGYPMSSPDSGVVGNYAIYRRVVEKRIYENGGALTSKNMFSLGNCTSQNGCGSAFENQQLTSGSALQSRSVHQYHGSARGSLEGSFRFYPLEPREGREVQTDRYDLVGTLLATVANTWVYDDYQDYPRAYHLRLSQMLNTLSDNNQVAKTTYGYDSYLNQTDVYEYDYGTGSPGSLLRRTHTDYLTANPVNGSNYATDPAIHLRRLPIQISIYNAAGTEQSRATYEYDNYTNDGNRAALVDRAGIPGLDSSFTTSYTKRGNVTRVSRWLLPSTEIATYPRYDIAGNVVAAKDPNGKVSQIDYSSTYGYGLPTSQVTPVPDPSGTYGSSTALTTTLSYDFSTGKATSVTDPNGKTTTYEYNDTLDRLTRAVRPAGGGETVYQYGDTVGNLYLRTQTKRDATNWIDQYVYFDGLGRKYRAALNEGAGSWNLADTEYDTLGRVRRVTNPYRAASATGATPANAEWTTTDYDALDRVISVQTPDTAVVRTAYQGNRVMVGDQAGKKRMSETDAAGRLINVWEITSPNPGETQITFTGATSSDLNGTYNANPTAYQYDVLGNLRKVTQAAQMRYFAYDSFSRLIRARNPEQAVNSGIPALTDPVTGNSQWSLAYTYDANGNLLTKTDPLNITSSYVYDALNRNTQVTYSTYPNGTFYVQRYYDGSVNGKGRAWYDVANNYRWEKPTDNLAYHYSIVNNYDAVGRPLDLVRNFLVLEGGAWQWKSYGLSRSYDLAGNVTAQTYPSGRTVNYGYDAAGRLGSFTGNLGGIAGVNYATGIQYNGYGLTGRETYGTQTQLALNLHYNNRLQMADLRLGLSSGNEWDWSRGALTFYYGTAAVNAVNPFQNSPDNNGNVLRQMNYVTLSAGGYVMPQIDDYQYDPLNRIQQVSESQQSSAGQVSSLFTQKYTYDRWGNRTIDVPGTTPSIPGVTRKNFVVDAATNRLTSSDGCAMTYDSAGNQTYDCVGTHSYDAENRMTKAIQGSSNNYYFYDGSGKRVRRILNGSQTWGGQETWFVYGFDGELAAEYAYNQVTAPLATAPQKEYGYRGGKLLVVWDGTQAGDDQLKWLVTDHLGSTRMEANKSGSLTGIRRHDYLPFGEELVASTGAQRGGVGYEPPQSGVRQRFGSKERDTETGLDYLQARYYGSVMGRFTSSDEFNPVLGKQGADDKEAAEKEFRQYLFQPAHWNRYVYALNNPCRYVDPDGMDPITVNLNIIYDQNSNYTEEQKKRIRETYIAQANKRFGNIEVKFNITETTGIASITNGEITSGKAEGAFNAFFTKSYLVNSSPEYTPPGSGTTFVRTDANNSDQRDLTHGLIHGLGIATGFNGYGTYASAELANEFATLRLASGIGIFYSDDRSARREIVPGWRTAKVEPVYQTVTYERTAFDIMRDGARKYQKK